MRTWREVADQLSEAVQRLDSYAASSQVCPMGVSELADEALHAWHGLRNLDEESNLVAHARRELEAIGYFNGEHSDPEFANSIIAAVTEFAHYGHSGSSAAVGVATLEHLLQFKPLAPITSNPEEWQVVESRGDEPLCWQNRRSGSVFSYDGGKTYYDLDDPRWHEKWSLSAWKWRREWRRHWNRVRARSARGRAT